MDFEQRLDKHERKFVLAEKRLGLIEKQLKATAKLVDFGMKLIIKDRKQQKEVDEAFNYKLNALIHSQQETEAKLKELAEQEKRSDAKLQELAEQQKHTDARFERFIAELRRRNGNGDSS